MGGGGERKKENGNSTEVLTDRRTDLQNKPSISTSPGDEMVEEEIELESFR